MRREIDGLFEFLCEWFLVEQDPRISMLAVEPVFHLLDT